MISALILLIPATALLYYPLAFEEFDTPKAYALVSFACFAVFFVRWRIVLKDRIAQALGLFCLSAAASTALSIDWHMSVFGNVKAPMGLLEIASLFVLYVAAAGAIVRRKDVYEIIDAMLLSSAIVSAYAIAQAMGYDFKSWNGVLIENHYTRPMSTLGHPNFMANYLAMVFPFALERLGRSKKNILRFLICCLIAMMSASILLSLSRGMILAAGAGLLAFGMMRRQIGQILKLAAAAVVISAVSLTFVPHLRKEADARLSEFLVPGPARIEYPKGAYHIWRKCPWFGTGTDTFEIAFRNARTDYYWKIERGGSPHRAHNDFMNILATQGTFGALAAILLTITIAMKSAKARDPISIAAISAVVVFYVAGLTSFVVTATGTLFILCLALISRMEIIESVDSLYAGLHSVCGLSRTADEGKSYNIDNQTLWPFRFRQDHHSKRCRGFGPV